MSSADAAESRSSGRMGDSARLGPRKVLTVGSVECHCRGVPPILRCSATANTESKRAAQQPLPTDRAQRSLLQVLLVPAVAVPAAASHGHMMHHLSPMPPRHDAIFGVQHGEVSRISPPTTLSMTNTADAEIVHLTTQQMLIHHQNGQRAGWLALACHQPPP